MPSDLKNLRALDQWAAQLACPSCLGTLRLDEANATCADCGRSYPVVDGIPVLIAERAQLPIAQ